MARVYITNGYRGKTITAEEYWPVGERDVTDQQADYLVQNGHAQYVTSSAEARRNPQLQRFVGQDTSVAVSVDSVLNTLEALTDAQLIELGAQNNIVIPRTATREQAILALMRVAVRPDANLVIAKAPEGVEKNDLLPRNEADRQFVKPGNNTLPSAEERDRLLRRGAEPLSDLEYSALTTEGKLAYERARGTANREGVDFDYAALTKAELIEEGAKRNVALEPALTKAEMIERLKGEDKK